MLADALLWPKKLNFAGINLKTPCPEAWEKATGTMNEQKMEENFRFTPEEAAEALRLLMALRAPMAAIMRPGDARALRALLAGAAGRGLLRRDAFGLNPIVRALQTARVAVEEAGLRRDGAAAIMLHGAVAAGACTIEEAQARFGPGVAAIIGGMDRIGELCAKSPAIESDNFRNLLVSLAGDMRVILIMIADCAALMRQIRDTPALEQRRRVALEAAHLYAPLAHKLGLYRLKSELEDLSLKYLQPDDYYMIKDKLNATKAARDAYIDAFIGPVERRLREAGLRFHIKGRTKSIHSIYQKMRKQKCAFEGIYDLFAIRVILQAPPQREKMMCWQAYSIVADMYQPNPKRLRDWLSVPKPNGYESLHTTVMGPGGKWVEVQIRSERMDEVAERGLAAHWRYKGVRSEGGIDEWLARIRTALEGGGEAQAAQPKPSLQEQEVYVFTPKGDLFGLAKGATVLDFAYLIHTELGNHCVGGRINGRAAQMRDSLRSGDTVEIATSRLQEPKREWLNIVRTPKAKAKIRLALKETQAKDGLYAKELLERRFRNKKVDMDEKLMARLIKKMGFKETSDFYAQIAQGRLEPGLVIDQYQELRAHEAQAPGAAARPADEFEYDNPAGEPGGEGGDVLVIDQSLRGIDYSLAKCCNPIYGDAVFGFVTAGGGVKIHRRDCPNAPELRRRFAYRILRAQWSGKGASQYTTTLRIIGNDNIGIVSNITSIIAKEEKIDLRSINIDSGDGLFRGNLVVRLDDTGRLHALIKRLRMVKGVKEVTRI